MHAPERPPASQLHLLVRDLDLPGPPSARAGRPEHATHAKENGKRKCVGCMTCNVDCAAMFRDFIIFEAAQADTCICALCSLYAQS